MYISELIFHILFWSIPHYWTTTSHYPVPFIPFVNTIANRDIWSTRQGGFVLRMIRVLQGWIYHRKFRIFELQLTRWIGTIFNFMLFSCKWKFWCKAVSPYIPCNTLKELEKVDSVVSPSLWGTVNQNYVILCPFQDPSFISSHLKVVWALEHLRPWVFNN